MPRCRRPRAPRRSTLEVVHAATSLAPRARPLTATPSDPAVGDALFTLAAALPEATLARADEVVAAAAAAFDPNDLCGPALSEYARGGRTFDRRGRCASRLADRVAFAERVQAVARWHIERLLVRRPVRRAVAAAHGVGARDEALRRWPHSLPLHALRRRRVDAARPRLPGDRAADVPGPAPRHRAARGRRRACRRRGRRRGDRRGPEPAGGWCATSSRPARLRAAASATPTDTTSPPSAERAAAAAAAPSHAITEAQRLRLRAPAVQAAAGQAQGGGRRGGAREAGEGVPARDQAAAQRDGQVRRARRAGAPQRRRRRRASPPPGRAAVAKEARATSRPSTTRRRRGRRSSRSCGSSSSRSTRRWRSGCGRTRRAEERAAAAATAAD